jgi:hypothetical protein
MAITVQNVVEGSELRVTKDGYWRKLRMLVEGVDPTNQWPLLLGGTYSEIDATRTVIGTRKVPTWADPDPYISGTACLEASQVPYPHDSRTTYMVDASYGPADLINGWKITVTGSGQYREASTDASGNPLFIIKYPNPNASNGSGGSGGNSSSGANLIDYGTANYLAPGSIVTFEIDVYTPPWSIKRAIQSRTNNAVFLGMPIGSVLCRDYSAESFIAGTRWHVRYTFEVLDVPYGFSQVFLFHDQYTGKVPSDVSGTDGTHGVLLSDPYKTVVGQYDFNTLGLPTSLLTG